MVVARISLWILCSGAREVSAGRGCWLGFFWGSHGPTGSEPLSCVAPAWVHRLRPGLAHCALACAACTEGIWQPYPAKPPRQGGCPRVGGVCSPFRAHQCVSTSVQPCMRERVCWCGVTLGVRRLPCALSSRGGRIGGQGCAGSPATQKGLCGCLEAAGCRRCLRTPYVGSIEAWELPALEGFTLPCNEWRKPPRSLGHVEGLASPPGWAADVHGGGLPSSRPSAL